LTAEHATTNPSMLGAGERQLVRDIIDAVVPGAVVSVFGSRSTGRARPYSDLDLLFTRPARLSLAQRAELRDRFEASRLPFLVDLVDADALAPGMAARVLHECQPL